MQKIIYGQDYIKNLERLKTKNPELGDEIDDRIRWFTRNPKDTRLKDHSLKKKMRGKLAFSITGDIRIIYRRVGLNLVQFLNIGRHIDVY